MIAVEVLGNQTKVELLHVLARAGRPMNSLELAEALNTNKVSIQRNLLRLEEQGLVTADLPKDQRAYQRVRVHWSVDLERVAALADRLKNYALGVEDTPKG